MKKIFISLLIFFPVFIFAQNVGIGITTPHPNAMLDITGINKGLLIPRGDVATRIALNANTAKGLLICDTVTNTIWIHNGNGLASGWQSLSIGNNYWIQNGVLGTEIKNTNTGGFWSSNATTLVTDPGIINPPVSGSGTRLMWMPQKGAFRTGTASLDSWEASVIGVHSFAAGNGNIASGESSTALGIVTIASGLGSLSAGSGSIASGTVSTALGVDSRAMGFYSTAFGNRTRAVGSITTAFGDSTVARAYQSVVIGRLNDSVTSADRFNWINTDPLFIVGNGAGHTNRHNAMVVYKNGNLVLKNPSVVLSDPPAFTLPVSSAGTRMMWLPEKGAFRAGTVYTTQWDAANIGLHSVATGLNSVASGEGSVAMGQLDSAMGSNSVALGFSTKASGESSFAGGISSKATGHWSFAFGNGAKASDTYSIAMGAVAVSEGSSSIALGSNARALADGSVAIGDGSIAYGINSVAIGEDVFASGHNSFAAGMQVVAKAYNSFAIGRFNDSTASSNTSWVATDPLLYVGNGSSISIRSNAMVVYKNGNTDISGYTQLGTTTEGAPAIKMKKLTVNTPNAQGAFNLVAHGLTQSKILSISSLVTVPGGYQILPNHEQAGFKYTLNVDNGNIAVGTVAGNSVNILNMPVKILITYEE